MAVLGPGPNNGLTFLQLVNRARVECGVSGASSPLLTLQGVTGESLRMAQWVNSAWIDLQTAHEDWQWMRNPIVFNTASQQQTYTPADVGLVSTFGNWKRDSFRCSSVGQNYADEQLLNYMDYNVFRNLYIYGSMRTTYARPVVVSIVPNDKALALGSIPDQAYVITGEYYSAPVDLVADADTPDGLPNRFHMMLVYRAMMSYGGYEAASEVYSRGEIEFKRMMNRLEIDQMMTPVSGPPLA